MKPLFTRLGLAVIVSLAPMLAQADVSVFVDIAPPPLPVYEQPAIPGDGYLWTPGYWAWDDEDGDYYWVPGTWIMAPYSGALWTPGYWGWHDDDNRYEWHRGYWGTHIGYYGGVNYGFGYTGYGYYGGHWDNGGFAYNRTVNNIYNVHVTNYYNAVVANNVNTTRVSYNGGHGGITLQPTRAEASIAAMPHTGPTQIQLQHERTAQGVPDLRASVNHGIPTIAATPQPARFNAPNVVAAHPQATMQPASNNNYTQRPQGMQQPQTTPHPQITPQQSYQPVARPQSMERPMQQPQREMNQPQRATNYAPQPQAIPRQQATPQYHTVPQQSYQPIARPQPMEHSASQMQEQRQAPQSHQNAPQHNAERDDRHDREK
jgi:hypothetical protein